MKRCLVCGSSEPAPFLSLGRLPLADAMPRPEEAGPREPRYPLTVALCAACGLVQLVDQVPPELLFCRNYPYFSSFSDTLLCHAREHAVAMIASRRLSEPSLVVELGSNDGYQLRFFKEAGIAVLGIDPAAGPAREAERRGIPTRQEFFTSRLGGVLRQAGVSADVVLAKNVLAHVPDPNDFVDGIGRILAPDGVACFEVPYVRRLVEDVEFDTIYHEHHCYFALTPLARLFRNHDLHLVRVEELSLQGGSLRLYVSRDSAEADGSVDRLLAEEAAAGLLGIDYYRAFAERVERLRGRLSSMLDDLKRHGKRLAAYGAAAKGAVLLNHLNLDRTTLEYVADRNVHKQGRVMPGVGIPICSPDAILETMPDYLLVLPWNLRDEILAQQQRYRERGGRFIIPVPEPRVV